MVGLNDKAIDAIRDGKWELNCLAMEVTRTDGTRRYCGSGSVRQDSCGKLAFTLYDIDYVLHSKTINEDITHDGLKAGQFFPRDHYFILRATDTWNEVWISTPTLDVHVDSAVTKGAVVSGTVPELSSEEDLSGLWERMQQQEKRDRNTYFLRPWYEYHFFSDIGMFPCNTTTHNETKVAKKVRSQSWSLSVAEFESCGFEFQLSKPTGKAVLIVSQKEPGESLQENADIRFVEALQFVLGKPIHWRLLQIGVANRKIARIRSTHPNRIPKTFPPIELYTGAHFESVWTLFDKHLSVIASYREVTWHQLTSRLFSVQHSSSYLWNARMLTLGVEVEGLLNDEYPAKVDGPANIAVAVDAVAAFLEQAAKGHASAVDTESCNRIKSSLGHLKGTSAINKLKRLAAQGVVRDEDVQAWGHVRHKSAHAQRDETAMTQDNSQRLDRVLVLFYHLIFHRLGYTGNYTDYGQLGYPTVHYP